MIIKDFLIPLHLEKHITMKTYKTAPLPFVGQKRMFASQFVNHLKQVDDNTIFVDLFGGSGLLSHLAKRTKPNTKVIYNDYDYYTERLKHIPTTNKLITDIRSIVGSNVPKAKKLSEEVKQAILHRILQEQKIIGYIDYITLSPSLFFSMKYANNFEELSKHSFYNSIRCTDYPIADDYIEGLEIVHEDYRVLFNKYKDLPNVVFLVDPPYLSTDVKTYTMSWKLNDYLDVLTVLKGHSYIYFTSNKSSILELCQWIGDNKTIGNPFEGATKLEFNARMNYNSSYTDIMLCKL